MNISSYKQRYNRKMVTKSSKVSRPRALERAGMDCCRGERLTASCRDIDSMDGTKLGRGHGFELPGAGRVRSDMVRETLRHQRNRMLTFFCREFVSAIQQSMHHLNGEWDGTSTCLPCRRRMEQTKRMC